MPSASPAPRPMVVTRQYQTLWPCASSTRAPYRLARAMPSAKPPTLRANSRVLLASSNQCICRDRLTLNRGAGLLHRLLSARRALPSHETNPMPGWALPGSWGSARLRARGSGGRNGPLTMRRFRGSIPALPVPGEHPTGARTRRGAMEPVAAPGRARLAGTEPRRRQKPPNTSEIPPPHPQPAAGRGCPWAVGAGRADASLPTQPSSERWSRCCPPRAAGSSGASRTSTAAASSSWAPASGPSWASVSGPAGQARRGGGGPGGSGHIRGCFRALPAPHRPHEHHGDAQGAALLRAGG